MKLEDYGLSRERGFLAATDPSTTMLPPLLHPARDMALDLPRILPTGRARTLLGRLPHIDLTEFCASASEAELRAAMMHYSFMVQSFVWGEPDAPRTLPANLAGPIWRRPARK